MAISDDLIAPLKIIYLGFPTRDVACELMAQDQWIPLSCNLVINIHTIR